MLRRSKKLRVYFLLPNIPWCVAVGCNNNIFPKNRKKGVSFYSFPKDENLKKRCLANV